MENIQNQEITPEEKQLEEDALKEVKEGDIRSEVIKKYGLNEDDNSELIDKLVGDFKEGQEKLSKAIGQKIKYREIAQKPPKEEKKEDIPQTPIPKGTPISEDELEKKLDAKLEERDLASMDLSDELKSEVRAYAKAKGIPYREAVKSPYFDFIKGKEDERIKAEEASASFSGKTTKAKRDFGSLSGEDIKNLSPEDFKEYKQWLKAQG